MTDIQTQIVEETQEAVIVSEEATFTTTADNTTIITATDNEPAVLTPEVTEPAPIAPAPPAVEVKQQPQQSRLSLAFAKISGGCGLCFSPLKSSSTDYHNLVETPTDEDEPHHFLPHDDGHGGSSVPVVITEDYKGEHSGDGDIIIASSSTDSHYLHRTTTEEVHEVKSRDITVTSTSAVDEAIFEEVTTVIEEHNVIAHQEGHQQVDMQEVQFSTQIVDTPAFVEEIVEAVVVDDSTLPIAAAVVEAALPVEETVAAVTAATPAPVVVPESVSLPASPVATRSPGPFAKLTKAKRSPSASLTSPSSPSSTSPLRERLGRFAKIIRPSETSSSINSKVESLKISTAPSTPGAASIAEEPVAAAVITAEPEEETVSTQVVEDKASGVPLTPVSPVLKELSVPSLRSDATPSLPPQPQQQSINNSRRSSLAVDTLVANINATTATTTTTIAGSTTSPSSVAIPSSWANSPTTLHQNDASTANSTSGQSLSRAGRASTMDSATEAGGSEAASLNSNSNKSNSNEHIATLATSAPTGKDGVPPIKANRRKSVLKKLGKIINTMNTNGRKSSMDGNESRKSSMDKNEKRMSRQGSLTLASPLESDERLGF
ncbi:hypothetical protein EC991_004626 [Linnemannia zychae]|nr:hypothetical protein EC991_004626 [Linnemannia zychae]